MKQQFVSLLLLILISLPGFANNNIKYKMIVAQDGSGDFTTIQEAIDATKAFPLQRITIFIKNGIYREKIKVPEWNNKLSLIGEDVEKTIIVWNDYFAKIGRGRNSTFFTYTLKVEADDFFAENLTVKNAAGRVGQAVAIHVDGNRCRFNNCCFDGNQDTAYLTGENNKQLFSNCIIRGTTDFIFGSATAVFDSCTIVSKSNSFITAASTTKGKAFGFVFLNCKLTAVKGVSEAYLGRPWRPYAKTVFINCEIGAHILPAGWKSWSNKEDKFATYYAEYENTGKGANCKNRVEWAHILSGEEASIYNKRNILGAWGVDNGK